ncbi:DIXC1 protein, partial [Amia calva]|nr:DIXC1 protein [Amia calva]
MCATANQPAGQCSAVCDSSTGCIFVSQQQLQAYVSWVNFQLKKKPRVKPVQDLRQDLRDGVILAHLIEIVAGEFLEGIHSTPSDAQEMRENVEKVLQFVASKRIRMHQTSAKDIVEGNLKSVMRLILALAAHFKPSTSANHRAGASAGRGSVLLPPRNAPQSQRFLPVAQYPSAWMLGSCETLLHCLWSWRSLYALLDDEIENPSWSVRVLVQQYEGQKKSTDNDQASPSGLSSPSPVHTPKGEAVIGQSEDKDDDVFQSEETQSKSEEVVKTPVGGQWAAGPPGIGSGDTWEDQLLEQQEQLEGELEEARRMISSLQALLLHGSLPEDEQEASLSLGGEGAENAEQQLIIIRSRLDQSMEEAQDLKKELLRYKQEARNLQGVKDALQQRMSVQESAVLQLKQELLRASMARDELHGHNAELQRKLEERSRLLSDYKKELGQKDRLLQQQQLKLDDALRKLSETSRHKTDLQRELEHKDSVLQELMSRELDEVACPTGCHTQRVPRLMPCSRPSVSAQTEELQLVRDALRSLRNSFSGHDPQHHTLDTLEQGVASLMDRLHALDSQRRHDKRSRGKSPGRRATHSDRDSWPPSTKVAHSHSSPVLSSSVSTKVLYFTDRSLTPFMVNIPKRLGEVTLRDFKSAVDREGSYRYHFKALDPEFGTVKEEVFHDEAVVPGWEGKIVAWVEEDHGEGR